jgi:3-hydroxyisobutyrate dehydrogenase
MEGNEGVIKNIKDNTIIIDHTTASADIARNYYQLGKESNFSFLDAPVSGGQAGAEKGILSVMVGGDQDQFDNAKSVMSAYGKTIELIGNAGSGQLAKMINQICIAGLVQGLSEAMAFGKKANLDMEKVLQVISKGAAQSWQMENRYKTMLKGEYEFGFAVDWMRKDLSICFNEAEKNGASLPVTKIVDKYYEEVQNNGGSRYDTSSLMTLVDDK